MVHNQKFPGVKWAYGTGLFEFSWMVKGEWGVSDHHAFKVVLNYTPAASVAVDSKQWRTSAINWHTYGVLIRETVTEAPHTKPLDEQVDHISEWVWSVNKSLFERFRMANQRVVKWWTRSLSEKNRPRPALKGSSRRSNTAHAYEE